MKSSYRDKNAGGWKGKKPYGGGGGSPPWKRGGFNDRQGDRPMLHDATCAGCGNACQVPFRPNGSKPVFCRICFRKDGDAPYEKPTYKPAYREHRGAPTPAGNGNAGIEAQLRMINEKLDALIDALSSDEDEA